MVVCSETNRCFSQPNGWKLEKQISFPADVTLTEHQKVVVVLKEIEKCLAMLCPDNLTTVNDWCVLYRHLCTKHELDISKENQRALHPRTFCDLVYKTKLFFHSLHKLRFALSEGQKRTYSTGMFLIGHIPSPTLTTHYALAPTEYENTNAKKMNRDSNEVLEQANKILAKFKSEVGPYYTEVIRDGEGLSKRVMDTYHEFSRRRALQNNDTQDRGLKTIISNMMTTERFLAACLPYERYTKRMVKQVDTTYTAYIKSYRETILHHLLVDKASADIKGAFSASRNEFHVLSSATIIENILDLKKNPNCGITTWGMDWRHQTANNKLACVVMMMITLCVTDPDEAYYLKNVLGAAGNMPSDRLYKPMLNFEEGDWPEQIENAVSLLCVWSQLLKTFWKGDLPWYLIRQKANFEF